MESAEDIDARVTFHKAAEDGNTDVMKKLLEENRAAIDKFDVDFRDINDLTALHLASVKGHEKVVELLIEHRCNVDLKGPYDWTALHKASNKGYAGIVKRLIKAKCDVDAIGNYSSTPLHEAAENGHLEVARILIENKCNINLSNGAKRTAVHLASKYGHLEVTKLLIEGNCNLNLRDEHNCTALHLATERGHAEIVRVLSCHRSLIHAQDFLGRTALYRAAEVKDGGKIKDILISAGATFDMKHLRTAFNMNSTVVIETLLQPETVDLTDFIECVVQGSANPQLRNDTIKTFLAIRKIEEEDLNAMVTQYEDIFVSACKNNIHEFVRYVTSQFPSSIDFNIGNPTPIWHAANGGHDEVFKLLLTHKDKIEYTKPAPDGTTPLVIAIARNHSHLFPHFLDLYDDPFDILLSCVKFNKTDMISTEEIMRRMISPERLVDQMETLMDSAIVSDSSKSFDFVRGIARAHSVTIDLRKHERVINKRLSLELRKKTGLKRKLLEDLDLEESDLVDLSKNFPVFNTNIEYNWCRRWELGEDLYDSCKKYLFVEDIGKEIIKRPCNFPEDYKENGVKQITYQSVCLLSSSCKQKDECQLICDLTYLCVQLEREMIYGKYDGSACMQYLHPQLSLIGSIAEGTRMGKVTEMDVTMTFAGIKKKPFRTGETATALLLPEHPAAKGHLQKFCKTGDIFDYPKFLRFLLQTLDTCLEKIELDDLGLEVVMKKKKYQPSQQCISDSDMRNNSLSMPITHCQQCVPAVTHTKLGPCLVFRRKGTDLFVTIDMIPVYPIEEKKTLELFTLVNKTLVGHNPPFWLDYFNSLMERDIILPENQRKIKGEGTVNYVAIKLLHYGQDNNYIIRPGQVMNIEHFNKNKNLKNVYIHMKALKDILQIPAKSYFMKQVVLLPEFMAKVHERFLAGDPNENVELKLSRLLFDALSRPELKKLFARKIDFVDWKVKLDSNNGSIIPIITRDELP